MVLPAVRVEKTGWLKDMPFPGRFAIHAGAPLHASVATVWQTYSKAFISSLKEEKCFSCILPVESPLTIYLHLQLIRKKMQPTKKNAHFKRGKSQCFAVVFKDLGCLGAYERLCGPSSRWDKVGICMFSRTRPSLASGETAPSARQGRISLMSMNVMATESDNHSDNLDFVNSVSSSEGSGETGCNLGHALHESPTALGE